MVYFIYSSLDLLLLTSQARGGDVCTGNTGMLAERGRRSPPRCPLALGELIQKYGDKMQPRAFSTLPVVGYCWVGEQWEVNGKGNEGGLAGDVRTDPPSTAGRKCVL